MNKLPSTSTLAFFFFFCVQWDERPSAQDSQPETLCAERKMYNVLWVYNFIVSIGFCFWKEPYVINVSDHLNSCFEFIWAQSVFVLAVCARSMPRVWKRTPPPRKKQNNMSIIPASCGRLLCYFMLSTSYNLNIAACSFVFIFKREIKSPWLLGKVLRDGHDTTCLI